MSSITLKQTARTCKDLTPGPLPNCSYKAPILYQAICINQPTIKGQHQVPEIGANMCQPWEIARLAQPPRAAHEWRTSLASGTIKNQLNDDINNCQCLQKFHYYNSAIKPWYQTVQPWAIFEKQSDLGTSCSCAFWGGGFTKNLRSTLRILFRQRKWSRWKNMGDSPAVHVVSKSWSYTRENLKITVDLKITAWLQGVSW